MEKLILFLITVLFLNSCQITGLISDERNYKIVVIKDIWLPTDALKEGTYPIRDRKSTAIGIQEIGDSVVLYARDYEGTINDNYKIGDTIKVIIFNHK